MLCQHYICIVVGNSAILPKEAAMTQQIKNTPEFKKNIHAVLGLTSVKQLTNEQKKKIKQNLHKMYVGLVFANWASCENTKLGTAKQKALEQIESFVKTMSDDKQKNAVAYEIAQQFAQLKKFASKQIMQSSTSELTLDKDVLSPYKAFGEKMTHDNMRTLREMFKQEQEKVKENNNTVEKQAKPNQAVLLQFLMAQQMQKAA